MIEKKYYKLSYLIEKSNFVKINIQKTDIPLKVLSNINTLQEYDLFINNAVPLTPAPDNLAILASDETPWSKQRPQRQPNSVPSSDLNEMIDNPLFEQEHNLVHNV